MDKLIMQIMTAAMLAGGGGEPQGGRPSERPLGGGHRVFAQRHSFLREALGEDVYLAVQLHRLPRAHMMFLTMQMWNAQVFSHDVTMRAALSNRVSPSSFTSMSTLIVSAPDIFRKVVLV